MRFTVLPRVVAAFTLLVAFVSAQTGNREAPACDFKVQQTSVANDAVADKDCETSRSPVTQIGIRKRTDASILPYKTEQDITAEDDARYIRVLVQVTTNEPCDWFLTVRNSQHHVVQTMTREDFRGTQTRWTMRVPGSVAKFELQRCGHAVPKVRFTAYVAMTSDPEHSYYSVKVPGHEEYVDLFKQSTSERSLGDTVGLLMNSYLETSWTCSGFMVTPDLFLTNWHCGGLSSFPARRLDFWSAEVVNDSILDLSFDGDETSREYVVTGDKPEAACEDLDFALLRVSPINSVGRGRPAILRRTPVGRREPIMIVHHPRALPKQITKTCFAISPSYPGWRGLSDTDFTHDCDTEAGSSGAPIFDQRGYVVGLHHLGFTYSKDCATKDDVSKAVRMDRILNYLRIKHRELYKLLDVRD